MSIHKTLVVDDEPLVRKYIEEILLRNGHEVYLAENGTKAFQALEKDHFDLVITDMKMPDRTGLEVVEKVKSSGAETMVIVVTAFGSIENVVEAMQMGAHHYLMKPFDPAALESAIAKAAELRHLKLENRYLRQTCVGCPNARTDHTLIAASPAMLSLMQQVEVIAQSKANVFISGESGTGKEVIAQAIHRLSPRANRPFIRVNCAALAESLIESEFFGHEKGAFTGAESKREGRFELADGGSLLLDEITEIPSHLQAKLLRVVQEREFERIGGKKTIKIDVRIISTSNREMAQVIRQKQFREDLYYRLNVLPIHLPALRERKEDILAMSEHYLQRLCQENHKRPMRLSRQAKEKLVQYPWPGNVRELINVIERCVVLCKGPQIELQDLKLDEQAC